VGGGGALYNSFWEIEIGWMRRNTINIEVYLWKALLLVFSSVLSRETLG